MPKEGVFRHLVFKIHAGIKPQPPLGLSPPLSCSEFYTQPIHIFALVLAHSNTSILLAQTSLNRPRLANNPPLLLAPLHHLRLPQLPQIPSINRNLGHSHHQRSHHSQRQPFRRRNMSRNKPYRNSACYNTHENIDDECQLTIHVGEGDVVVFGLGEGVVRWLGLQETVACGDGEGVGTGVGGGDGGVLLSFGGCAEARH